MQIEFMKNRPVLIWGFILLIHAMAAWFSLGWQHPDEHFQLLEFARFLLGKIEPSGLPWEFTAKMRPTLQVWIASFFMQTGNGLGLENPFIQSFLMRLAMAIASLLALWKWHNTLTFSSEMAEKIHFFLCFFSWPLVYVHVRFSSESLAALFLVLAMANHSNEKRKWLTGALLGFAFLARFQTAFFIAGFGLAGIVFEKASIKSILLWISGFLLVFVLGTGLDFIFYGAPVFSPWAYFDQNILKGIASKFGTEPWYWYFSQSFEKLIPPFSLLAIGGFLFLPFQNKEKTIGWACALFLVAHMFVAHKEWRFLFPLAGFLPLAVVRLLERFSIGWKDFALFHWVRNLFYAVNGVCLFLVIFRPANDQVSIMKTIYNLENRPNILWYEKSDLYMNGPNFNSYFCPKKMMRIQVDSAISIHKKEKQTVLFFVETDKGKRQAEKIEGTLIFSTFPSWIENFNVNGWLNRSAWYRLYLVEI